MTIGLLRNFFYKFCPQFFHSTVPNPNMDITVIGSGICGVTSALALQSRFPSAKISIVAESFNEDITSYGAAGIFRPGNGIRRKNNEDVGPWVASAYKYYDEILHSSESSKAGVMKVGGYLFSGNNENITRNKNLEGILPIYRSATREEVSDICPGNDFKYGAYFETMVIESAKFLPWALNKFERGGGKIEKRRINSFFDLKSELIINCTGLGARALCGDERLVPIRGQVFKVKAPWVKMFYYGDYDTYIIPGSTTVTLGGTRNFDSYNTTVDPFDAQSILTRCAKLLPNLQGAEIVKEWVGLRPYRDEVRVEQDCKLWDEKGLKVVHNYGHGGYGVTLAPGTAQEVVSIVEKFMNRSGGIGWKSRL